MAKNRIRYEEAPPRNDVYFGMLLLLNLSMVVGCVLLALECTEYDWDSQPKGGPSISLPSMTSSGARPAGGAGANVPPPAPAPAPPAPGPMNPMPPMPGAGMGQLPPADVQPRLPAVPVAPVVAATPPETAPMPSRPQPLNNTSPMPDTGPRPGFNPYLPR